MTARCFESYRSAREEGCSHRLPPNRTIATMQGNPQLPIVGMD
jgi:hypothetical protein